MLTEIETLTTRMDAGFDKSWRKIDSLQQDFNNHLAPCATKFAGIDVRLAVMDALNCVEGVQEKKKLDWGQWGVRLILGLLAAGMIGLWLK